MDLTIDRVERIPTEFPFRPAAGRNMHRPFPDWRYLKLFEVGPACGPLGYEEGMRFYGCREVSDDGVADRVKNWPITEEHPVGGGS